MEVLQKPLSFFLVLMFIDSAESGSLEKQYTKIQEIQAQLSLHGTEHEHLANKQDTILQEIHKATLNKQDTGVQDRLKQLESALETIEHTQQALKAENDILTATVARLDNAEQMPQYSGTVYKRWGRTSCPGNGSTILYSGFAAGGHYTHGGSSPNMLCLPADPVWGKYDDSLNSEGDFVYGVEYQSGNGRDIFGKALHDHDVPCVVCEVRDRANHIMIPGRTSCYDGWTREYWGYLMSDHYKHPLQTDFQCIDADPEALPGGHENKNGYLLYFVEARCGSLKCPPYVKGRELPCVVCTK